MNLRQYLAAGTLCLAGILAINGCGGYAGEASPKPTAQAIATATPKATSTPITSPKPSETPKATEEPRLTLEQIAEEMNKPSVEAILEGTGIQYINDNNFEKYVTNGDKPSVVMFYDREGDLQYSKREAIILRELNKKFNNQINLYAFKLTEELTKSIQKGTPNRYNLKGGPSLALYHKIDLTKDKTPGKENKQIDILRGGPNRNEIVSQWITNVTDYLIPTNLIEVGKDEKGEYVWRWGNSANYIKVYLKK